MSAATTLEQQAHAHLWNALRGFKAESQMAAAELVMTLVAAEAQGAVLAAVARRPVLVEVAAMRPEIAVTVRDMYDGVTGPATLLHYRAEALRRAAECVTEVEHIDRLLGDPS
ncbi:MAG: hypothetical protein ACRDP6_47255 [Actinoallomurus sp.]